VKTRRVFQQPARSDGYERWDIESRHLLEEVDGGAEALAAVVARIEADPAASPTGLALVYVDDAGRSATVAMGAGPAAPIDRHRATWARRPARPPSTDEGRGREEG
jgi:hypothetical protein